MLLALGPEPRRERSRAVGELWRQLLGSVSVGWWVVELGSVSVGWWVVELGSVSVGWWVVK